MLAGRMQPARTVHLWAFCTTANLKYSVSVPVLASAVHPMTESVLDLDRVVKTYGDFKAIDNISLSIPKGSIYGFLGPNGAGKTTTFRAILEIIKPNPGNITILGSDSALDVRDRNGLAAREYDPDALSIRQNFPAGCLANRSTSTRQGIVEAVDLYCVTPSLFAASATLCESKPQCTQRLA